MLTVTESCSGICLSPSVRSLWPPLSWGHCSWSRVSRGDGLGAPQLLRHKYWNSHQAFSQISATVFIQDMPKTSEGLELKISIKQAFIQSRQLYSNPQKKGVWFDKIKPFTTHKNVLWTYTEISNGGMLVHFQRDLLFTHLNWRQSPMRWKCCRTQFFIAFDKKESFPLQESEYGTFTS